MIEAFTLSDISAAVPTAPDSLDAHDYAERIRGRLSRRLQELREADGLTTYAPWLKC